MANVPGTGRVVLGGHLGTNEEFSTGFWVTAEAIDDQGSVDNLNANLAQVFEAHHSNICSIIPSNCGYDRQSLYWYLDEGPDASHISVHNFTGIVGTAGSTAGWNGLSAVVTLETDRAGRSGRGRMYLPALAKSCSGGLFVTDDLGTVLNDVQAIFQGINGIDDNAPHVVVFSNALSATNAVTSVHVDNKPDRQWRREKSIKPTIVNTLPVA